MDADRLLIIALVYWQAWDEATRDEWSRAWKEACEREPEAGA